MIIDETYDKYLDITHNWSEEKHTHSGARIYKVRSEMYSENMYYVIGIGVSHFLNPDKYDPEKDWVNDPELNPKAGEDDDPKFLIKWMCGSTFISIDDLYELSNRLKEAGAKEVYLHPAFWTDNKAFLDHYISDEWLVVIPKEN